VRKILEKWKPEFYQNKAIHGTHLGAFFRQEKGVVLVRKTAGFLREKRVIRKAAGAGLV
jgi:hypothetical protein